MSGVEQAAIFLMSLGEREAAEVLKHMSVGEVQRLGKAMASMKKVTRDQADNALKLFTDNVISDAPLAGGSPRFLRRLLTSSLGEEQAEKMLDRLMEDGQAGLDSLQLMDAKEIADVIYSEHPQVVAIVMAGLDPAKSAQVLDLMPKTRATDIVRRIALLNEVPQDSIEELDTLMQQNISSSSASRVAQMGGVRCVADILNAVGKPTEERIFEQLNELDAVLSQEIQDNMFVFESLIDVDDRGMQMLAREVTTDQLVVALKGADEKLANKFYSNMSKRAAEMLKSDLEAKGPVRLAEVEEAQREIVTIARKLADDGTLILGNEANDFV
ncbi:MAG: flagellar motor switch protein FliG [Gammaproteobacteria bacterium]|jgi:flagellar motor switch protein FliG|nr:flagellar motor switch protein FliG [Gammaproteobacteria bacterium]